MLASDVMNQSIQMWHYLILCHSPSKPLGIQAKRLYPLISLVGNLGPILGGLTMSAVSHAVKQYASTEETAFQLSLQALAVCSTVAGVLVCALYAVTMRLHAAEMTAARVETAHSVDPEAVDTNMAGTTATLSAEPRYSTTSDTHDGTATEPCAGGDTTSHSRKHKPALSFSQSLRVLASDPYLRNIATMVLAYGVTMELTEIIWKSAVKRAFPVKTEYLAFTASYSTYVGVAAFVMMLLGSGIVDRLGWQAGALVTPIAVGATALPFFAALIGGDVTTAGALRTVVYAGLVQNVITKASKYAVFDPVKEMAYIPLDAASKTRGKAAIDVLGEWWLHMCMRI
jgi:ATP/ADP translocase